MTPTLLGRIQTRIVVLGTIGVIWTILIGPLLSGSNDLADTYGTLFAALFLVMILGVVIWEPIYHFLQQFRWEKDWPTSLGLLTGISEGIVAGVVLASSRAFPAWVFVVHFATTWLVVWITVNGPLRVVALRWRYRGGRFL